MATSTLSALPTHKPTTLQTLALLRFRAATAGEKAIQSFQSYTYDPNDALEPFRFEALCRIASIAEVSCTLPEMDLFPPPAPQFRSTDAPSSSRLDNLALFRITLGLLDEWITTSAEITREVHALDPSTLSSTGMRMVQFLAGILAPHESVWDVLPSAEKRNRRGGRFREAGCEERSQKQIILDFFEDCSALLEPVRSELRRILLCEAEGGGEEGERSVDWCEKEREARMMAEIYGPLNTFIFAPAIHFFHWLLYYWRRHATVVPALPFEETVIEAYQPAYLPTGLVAEQLAVSNTALGIGIGFGMVNERDPRVELFWKASRYPVRGVWGCQTVYGILRDLLEQNVRIARQRLFDGGAAMSSRLGTGLTEVEEECAFPSPGTKPKYEVHKHHSSLTSKLASIPSRLLLPASKHPNHHRHYQYQTVSQTPHQLPRLQPTKVLLPTKLARTSPTNNDNHGTNIYIFTCPSCTPPKHFTMRKDLRRHIESIHFQTTGFWCEVKGCSRHMYGEGERRPFNRWDNLVRHGRRVHGR